ncbi:hypothetical protein AGLY_016953 [Aphis glycines]|uniref:Uncharacterized protein n=1 Tax=Aphis glycines TaxID=307491 RepID=A0A6G0SWW9_APHGL|nr:hypothetical protein AGLY_016953 [Aphis glycines]
MNFISMLFLSLTCILKKHVATHFENDEDDDSENPFADGYIEDNEDEIERVLDMLNTMEAELSNGSQLNLSERTMTVTKLWQEIMMRFEDMGLEQTVGLLLFRGSNYIEYVDCDIEGDTGTILRAENVEYLSVSSSQTEIRDVVMSHTQAEVLLQLKYEYELLARDEDEIQEFYTKVRMITSVWGLSDFVSSGIMNKFYDKKCTKHATYNEGRTVSPLAAKS